MDFIEKMSRLSCVDVLRHTGNNHSFKYVWCNMLFLVKIEIWIMCESLSPWSNCYRYAGTRYLKTIILAYIDPSFFSSCWWDCNHPPTSPAPSPSCATLLLNRLEGTLTPHLPPHFQVSDYFLIYCRRP